MRRSLAEAEKWADKAVEAEVDGAATLLAEIKAARKSDPAADDPAPGFKKALADAQFRASLNHSYRMQPEEMKTAMNWLLRSAENGCPQGMYYAGLLLFDGEPRLEIPRDREKAMAYLQAAGEAGIREAAEKAADPDARGDFWRVRQNDVMQMVQKIQMKSGGRPGL